MSAALQGRYTAPFRNLSCCLLSVSTSDSAAVWLTRVLRVADIRRLLLSLISCFAGGVFFATCLLDLLPDYLQSINEAFSSAGIKVGERTRLKRPEEKRQVKPCHHAQRRFNV